MLRTTVGQALVNHVLPEQLRDHTRVLDKKGLASLLQRVAEEHPDKYNEVSHQLGKIGQETAFHSGGFSFGLGDMKTPPETERMRDEMRAHVKALQIAKIPEADKQKQIIDYLQKQTK